MKLLVLLVSHEMNPDYLSNIQILHEYLINDPTIDQVDYCGISNTDDFSNYEHIILFKYKSINTKRQLSKVCDFISEINATENKLDYDWYLKFRPDFKLLGPISFESLSDRGIHARARAYRGPKRIQYGMSVNGEGIHKNVGSCAFDPVESELVLDDCVYLFHNNVITMGAFEPIQSDHLENEWFHTNIWNGRNIPLNIIGINTICLKYDTSPGHINM
jgi:hypothetical protein